MLDDQPKVPPHPHPPTPLCRRACMHSQTAHWPCHVLRPSADLCSFAADIDLDVYMLQGEQAYWQVVQMLTR